MSAKKTFCILEQGSLVDAPEAYLKKQLYTTASSDFYRLNWKSPKDSYADLYAPDIVWSEGRSLLYEHVPKEYEYYIFLDDDVLLLTKAPEGVVTEIRRLLEHYKPLAGTFLLAKPRLGGWFLNPNLDMQSYQKREAFPIAGFDLCVHIFHRSFAEAMFPVIHHGAGKSMWYAHWACHNLFPKKQLCFTGVQYANTRGEPHENEFKRQYNNGNAIVSLFNSSVIGKPKVWGRAQVIRKTNMEMFRDKNCVPSTSGVEFNTKHLAKIYRIQNPAYVSRVARARTKPHRFPVSFYIHHKYKCVFLVIPKVGSRTTLLRLKIYAPDIIRRAKSEGIDLEINQRLVIKGTYVGCYSKESDDLIWECKRALGAREKDYFLFAFVRNPAERVASAYRDFFIRRNKPGRLTPRLRKGGRFDDLVDHVCSTPDGKLNQHLLPQFRFLDAVPEGRQKFVGRLENYDSDWGHVARVIGADLSTDRLNVTRKSSSPSNISDLNYSKLKDRYSKDFEVGGYE